MVDTNNIQVFQMSSGTLVISEVVSSEGDEVVLRYPLEMNFTFEESGATRLYLNRWMPYSEDDTVTINARTVESKTTCSEKYRNMYDTRISHFKQLIQASLEYVNGEGEDELEEDSQETESEGHDDNPYNDFKPTFH
jgi:hypothetical protein